MNEQVVYEHIPAYLSRVTRALRALDSSAVMCCVVLAKASFRKLNEPLKFNSECRSSVKASDNIA